MKKHNKNIEKLFSAYTELNAKNPRTDEEWKRWEVDREKLKSRAYDLYRVDESFESLTKANILKMIVLNQKLRFMAFHNFGSEITLEK